MDVGLEYFASKENIQNERNLITSLYTDSCRHSNESTRCLMLAGVSFSEFEAVEDFRMEFFSTITCCKGRGL